jgi:erythromycin esterase-like protein
VTVIADDVRPLEGYDPLLERIGDARFALLGGASHGTHEF